MRVAQQLVVCKSTGEVVRVVDRAGREELARWKKEAVEEALERWVEQHLGPRWQRQREVAPTPWLCPHCGPRDSRQVKRNGHYSRRLVVVEGVISLRVPQLCCLGCGRSLALGALFLPARKRYWLDLDQAVTEAYLSGMSYRQIKAMVERRIDSAAGLMSLWRRFQEVAEQANSPGLGQPLVNLYLDEAYIRVGGKPSWALLALGEGHRGRRCYLGACLSLERSQGAWQRLLEGLNIPSGGQGLTVVHDGDQALAQAVALVLPWAKQRLCLWHQLHNLVLGVRERYAGEPQKQREIIQEAKTALVTQVPQGPRTTSPLERAIKELRRRTRPMDGFGSWPGARNFLRAWMVKENTRRAGEDWLAHLVA